MQTPTADNIVALLEQLLDDDITALDMFSGYLTGTNWSEDSALVAADQDPAHTASAYAKWTALSRADQGFPEDPPSTWSRRTTTLLEAAQLHAIEPALRIQFSDGLRPTDADPFWSVERFGLPEPGTHRLVWVFPAHPRYSLVEYGVDGSCPVVVALPS